MDEFIAIFKPYLDQYGYWALLVANLVEGMGPPMPGLTLLVLAAFLAARGELAIFYILIVTWAATVAGSLGGYAIGRRWGRDLVLHYGQYFFITHQRLRVVENFLQRHGVLVIVGARFFDGPRQLHGLVAGIAGMCWTRFVSYSALGGALWVAFWGVLAYKLGGELVAWRLTLGKAAMLWIGVVAAAAVTLVIYLVARKKR